MKGSLGINIFWVFFPRYFLMILFYMFVHDLMCDKDLNRIGSGADHPKKATCLQGGVAKRPSGRVAKINFG